MTWHHNGWAENIDQRMPRTRRGQIHVVNNLFTPSGNSSCTNAGVDARLLVENNIYLGVNNPVQVASGNVRVVGNVFTNTTRRVQTRRVPAKSIETLESSWAWT